MTTKVTKDFIPPEAIENIEHQEDKQADVVENLSREVLKTSDVKVDPLFFKKKYKLWPKNEEIKAIKKESKFKIKFNFWKMFSIFSMFVFLLLFLGVLYSVNEGKFTPIFLQNTTFDPTINVDNLVTNNYEFSTNNSYIIQNEINCPNIICNCGNNS